MTVDARYPIGRFTPPPEINHAVRHEWITAIAVLPRQLEEVVRGMPERELSARYREGGWTVRQVVHHVADSHMNAYCRFRLALTEQEPTIKPYNEGGWAELSDAVSCSVEVSIDLLRALHTRWVALLKSMDDAAFERKFIHPDHGARTLNLNTALYAWHGRHHLAHIRMARGLANQD